MTDAPLPTDIDSLPSYEVEHYRPDRPQTVVRPARIDEVDTAAMLSIVKVDGRPMLESVRFVRPVDPALLVNCDWPAYVNFALEVESLYVETDGTLDPDQRARAARNKVTDATLAAAVKAHGSGGIRAVMKELNVSERTAHRYMERARTKKVKS